MKIQTTKGIFELTDLTSEAVNALCEAYANAPETTDDPISWLHESRETTIAAFRGRIRDMLRKSSPGVGYTLFPLSQAELDRQYIELSGITEIG